MEDNGIGDIARGDQQKAEFLRACLRRLAAGENENRQQAIDEAQQHLDTFIDDSRPPDARDPHDRAA